MIPVEGDQFRDGQSGARGTPLPLLLEGRRVGGWLRSPSSLEILREESIELATDGRGRVDLIGGPVAGNVDRLPLLVLEVAFGFAAMMQQGRDEIPFPWHDEAGSWESVYRYTDSTFRFRTNRRRLGSCIYSSENDLCLVDATGFEPVTPSVSKETGAPVAMPEGISGIEFTRIAKETQRRSSVAVSPYSMALFRWFRCTFRCTNLADLPYPLSDRNPLEVTQGFPSRVQGFKYRTVRYLAGGDRLAIGERADRRRAEAAKRKAQEVKEPIKSHGGARDADSKVTNSEIITLPQSNRGTSSSYRIARLRRDHPEVVERLERGEFPSVAAASRGGVPSSALSPWRA